jgi:hypothetical protein
MTGLKANFGGVCMQKGGCWHHDGTALLDEAK